MVMGWSRRLSDEVFGFFVKLFASVCGMIMMTSEELAEMDRIIWNWLQIVKVLCWLFPSIDSHGLNLSIWSHASTPQSWCSGFVRAVDTAGLLDKPSWLMLIVILCVQCSPAWKERLKTRDRIAQHFWCNKLSCEWMSSWEMSKILQKDDFT